MSVLSRLFNYELNQESPVQVDYQRVVNYDEDGNEIITWVEVDYGKIQKENGKVSDWSLNSLLAAGVNPNFSIHTGLNTRLEGIGVISQAEAIADSILAEQNNDEK